MKNKKLFLVSYRFAPEASAGAIRSIKFAKYLPNFNWDVTVLTASNSSGVTSDQNTLSELPKSIKVIRSFRLDYSFINQFIITHFPKPLKGLSWRINNLLTYLVYPDFSGTWLCFALPRAILNCAFNKYEAVYSTYAPASNHLIALIISKLYKLPWVCDYRDLWTHDFEYKPLSNFHKYLDRSLENLFIKNASAVLTTSTGLTKIMQDAYPFYADKIITLPNGYDPSDQPKSTNPKSSCIRFSHIGTLYSSRSINHLINALDKVLNKPEFNTLDIELKLVGQINTKITQPQNFKLNLTGWLNRQEALEEVASCDVCLLIMHTAEGGHHPVPQKLFEYLAFGKILLATGTEKCFATDILNQSSNTYFVKHDDDAALQATIENILTLIKTSTLEHHKHSHQFIERFSRLNTSKTLSDVLNACNSKPRIVSQLDFKLTE